MRTIIILALLAPVAAIAQQTVIFDEIPAMGGIYTLRNVGGGDMLMDETGAILPMDPIHQLSLEERVARGITETVSRNGLNNRGMASGPTFNLNYLDVANGTGKGFNDPQLGAQRRAVLQQVFTYLTGIIDNSGTIDVDIRVSFFASPTSNPFAFSAPYFFGAKGFNNPFPAAHLTTGSDPAGSYPDGYIQFNFSDALNYNLDPTATPSAAQFDFYTVALHEALHLLGFTSLIGENGQTQASIADAYSTYDAYLFDINKDPMLTVTGSGANSQVTKPDPASLTNGQVWFEVSQGLYAPVYSPSGFTSSSLDHFDSGRNPGANYVMHPSLSRGQAFRLLHEHEVYALQNLGYTCDISMATSIGDDAHIEAVASALYPNPVQTQSKVQINLGKTNEKEILVVVYDMMGRQSYSKVLLNPGPGPVTAIDPYNNLAPGMYIVVGSSRDELFNQKLVIR